MVKLRSLPFEQESELQPIPWRAHPDNANPGGSDILLELEMLVDREQGVEPFGNHELEQLAVPF
jgi:hypothetical protein